MFKVFISRKLDDILSCGLSKVSYIVKNARGWDDLSIEEQRQYLERHPGSKRRLTAKPKTKEFKEIIDDSGFKMSREQIQESIKKYQSTGSQEEFAKLRDNFLKTIANTVNQVIGSRYVTKDQKEDITQDAFLIFLKALENANPDDPGIISYIKKTLLNQLIGKARATFRHLVTIGPKDRKLLREVQKYLHTHHGETIDYDQMARTINNDPQSDITNATPALISDLLQSGDVSLESDIGEDDESSRKMYEVLGPEGVSSDLPGESPFYETPEEETSKSLIKSEIEKSISELDDPLKETLIKMHFGMTVEGEPMGIGDIAKEFKRKGKPMPRSTIRRELERAKAKLYNMERMKKLRFSQNLSNLRKAFNENIKFIYIPKTFSKIGSTYIVDGNKVNKYANQVICDCGECNCYHKDVVENLK